MRDFKCFEIYMFKNYVKSNLIIKNYMSIL